MSVLPTSYAFNLPQRAVTYGHMSSGGTVIYSRFSNGASFYSVNPGINLIDLELTIFAPNETVNPVSITAIYTTAAGETPLVLTFLPQIEDAVFPVQVTLPPVEQDGELILYYGAASSDGLPLVTLNYPLPPAVLNNPTQQMTAEYKTLLAALTGANNRGQSGSLQSELGQQGKVGLEHKDHRPASDSLAGATQQAIARLAGLTKVITNNHVANELLSLELWLSRALVSNLEFPTELKELANYATSITAALTNLTLILDQYSINIAGSTVTNNSGAVNQAAQAIRYTSNSVFDIDSPTTLINTNYLIQQSSKATFRQTGIDQLSCFNSWTRAEETVTHQAQDIFNYAERQIASGADFSLNTFGSGIDAYREDYKQQVGGTAQLPGYTLVGSGTFDFNSKGGGFWLRVAADIIQRASAFVVDVTRSVFIKAAADVAIEGQRINITSKGKLTLDADEIVLRSSRPLQVYIGTGPEYMQQTFSGLAPVINPELLRLPELSVFEPALANLSELVDAVLSVDQAVDLFDPAAILPLYTLDVAYTTSPLVVEVSLPTHLLDYPKSPGLDIPTPQPNNGVVKAAVYPKA